MNVDCGTTGAGKSAVVLVSGGLDSAVTLAVARSRGFRCIAMSVDYGQRHRVELAAAAAVAKSLGAARHVVIGADLRTIGGSALTDDRVEVPKERGDAGAGVPVTYVPARNLIMLSLAAGLAETERAGDLFIGANAVDYSGYPDCREPFLHAFERTATLGTKAGAEGGRPFHVHAPLVAMTKAQIIRLGAELGVDFSLTTSCYDPTLSVPPPLQPPHSPSRVHSAAPKRDGVERIIACGRCDSCVIRARGFAEAGIADPTEYAGAPAAAGRAAGER